MHEKTGKNLFAISTMTVLNKDGWYELWEREWG